MDDPTIPANDRYVQYVYSGGAILFNYDFPVYDHGSVAVYINGTKLLYPNEYSVTISPLFAGGTVTLFHQPATGATVTIIGDTPICRTEHYGAHQTVDPRALDAECDKTVMRLQQINTKTLGCLRNAVEETEAGNTILPASGDRSGHIAAWDSDTGALTYIGDGAMDERYLLRANNLSDIADTDAARDNLHIIDGRAVSNNGEPVEYRPLIEFDRAFKVSNEPARTTVALHIVPTSIGGGIPLITHFSTNTLWCRSVRGGGNISLNTASDGSLIIADAATRGWSGEFSAGDWQQIGASFSLVIPYSMHRVARDRNLVAVVRDGDGYTVTCDVLVDHAGTVSLFSKVAFGGSALIYGGLSPLIASNILINPMVSRGDIIYSSDDSGTPAALHIGSPDQVLCADEAGRPHYKTLGPAAWMQVNIPGGLPQLDMDGSIPPEFLPYETMTYCGTFGSAASTTGGDLPASGALDGDVYVCAAAEYYSQVAQASFIAGQQAIYSGA